ncbi:CsgG/HfaB family protein [Stratiformator vulcanicus]|uniref:CsgG/HfaB family protein n=1 Tax=Stratiformator vulcanicus TaxID=2527980 RepID=UPI0028780F39|nr:CsgG/HfaB family protein [Stratiformator vulcanicus]
MLLTRTHTAQSMLAAAMLCLFAGYSSADDSAVRTAVLGFSERGEDIAGHGAKLTDLLFAELILVPQVELVERQDLAKAADELELNLTGMVATDKAVKIGQLSGAKLLVTGSIVQVDAKLVLVAKLIGTETSRVSGASVRGRLSDDFTELAAKLGSEIGRVLEKDLAKLVPNAKAEKDVVAELQRALKGKPRPTLFIEIAEEHVGQRTVDPAAQTELTRICDALGFEVLDPETADRSEADVVITGEAFSEFAVRRGNLVSVKARVEVKAVERATGKILASDRENKTVVDLAEHIAGKKALEQAATELARRVLPKAVGAKD